MKNFKVLIAVAFVFAFALSAFGQNKINIFGYYSIENATKDFADISEINLAGDIGLNDKPPFYGLIRMKSKKAKDFKLLKPTLSGKTLTFSTTTVNGINYKFSGQFTKLGDFPELKPNGEVLLIGTLTKYRGKKKIAFANVKLSYEAGD